MVYLEDVKEKLKRKNKILFSRDSLCLQNLLIELRKQDRKVIILWALECAENISKELTKKYPNDSRFENAINLSKEWAHGKIKMPLAKKAILQAHAVAKEISNPVDIALCHALGQGCSAVHVETHAIGLPMYELTAIVLENGIENCEEKIEEKINEYIKSLKHCSEKLETENLNWASFLMKKQSKNKEQLLYEKNFQNN